MSQRREAQQEEHKIDPQVQAMSKEEVKLFAAMVRACGEEEGQLADQSDEQVASSLLWLQDNGYISIEFDGEEIGIRLLDPPSTGQRGEQLALAEVGVRPPRRDRRRKKRRKR